MAWGADGVLDRGNRNRCESAASRATTVDRLFSQLGCDGRTGRGGQAARVWRCLWTWICAQQCELGRVCRSARLCSRTNAYPRVTVRERPPPIRRAMDILNGPPQPHYGPGYASEDAPDEYLPRWTITTGGVSLYASRPPSRMLVQDFLSGADSLDACNVARRGAKVRGSTPSVVTTASGPSNCCISASAIGPTADPSAAWDTTCRC